MGDAVNAGGRGPTSRRAPPRERERTRRAAMRAGGVGGLALEVQRVAVVRAVAGGGGAGGLELTWKASRKLWK